MTQTPETTQNPELDSTELTFDKRPCIVLENILKSEIGENDEFGHLLHESDVNEWNILLIEESENIIISATDGEFSHTYELTDDIWNPLTDDTKYEFFDVLVEMAEKADWKSKYEEPKFEIVENFRDISLEW